MAQKEQGGWLVHWRRGLTKNGTALVYKGKEGRRPWTQSPFLPILSKCPLGRSLWSLRHHRKKEEISFTNGPSDGTVFTAYNPGSEDRSLPAIIPLKIQGITLWAYLDTGLGRNFISSNREAKFEAYAPWVTPVRHYQRCPETVPTHTWSETWFFKS